VGSTPPPASLHMSSVSKREGLVGWVLGSQWMEQRIKDPSMVRGSPFACFDMFDRILPSGNNLAHSCYFFLSLFPHVQSGRFSGNPGPWRESLLSSADVENVQKQKARPILIPDQEPPFF